MWANIVGLVKYKRLRLIRILAIYMVLTLIALSKAIVGFATTKMRFNEEFESIFQLHWVTRARFPIFLTLEKCSDQNVLAHEIVVRTSQQKCDGNCESGCIHYVQD